MTRLIHLIYLCFFCLAPFFANAQKITSWEEGNQLGMQAYQTGEFKTALIYWQQALELAQKNFGDSHPNYATAINNLALLNHRMGNHNKAEPLYKQALEIRKKTLGKNHPEYATSLSNLASLYKTTSRYEQAEKLFVEAMNIQQKVLGEHHPAFATTINNLAVLYDHMGNYDKAMPLFLKAAEIKKTSLGATHPEYATSLNNLAGLYKNIGRYKDAILLYQESLEIKKQNYGKGTPDYALTLNNLANLFFILGNYDQAEAFYYEVLETRKNKLGENHPNYAITLNNLGEIFFIKGDFLKAEKLYIQSSQIFSKSFGRRHPYYASTINQLAKLYTAKADYNAAELLYQESLGIYKEILGKSHPQYAKVLSNLAGLKQIQGLYNQSEGLYLDAINIFLNTVGGRNFELGYTMNGLAKLYLDLKQNDKALYALNEVEKIFSNNNSRDIKLLYDLALSFHRIYQNQKAVTLLQKCEKILHKEDYFQAKIKAALARVYSSQGTKLRQAEKTLLALELFQSKIVGIKHPDYIETMIELGKLYDKLGDYAKAEIFLEEGLALHEKYHNRNSLTYANILSTIGEFYFNHDQLIKAESSLLLCEKIQEKNIGNEHPDYAATLLMLSKIYQLLENQQEDHSTNKRTESIETLSQKDLLYFEMDSVKPTSAISHESFAKNSGRDFSPIPKSLIYFRESERIKQKAYGNKHISFQILVSNLPDDLTQINPQHTKLIFQTRDNILNFIKNDFLNLTEAERLEVYEQKIAPFFEFFNSYVISNYNTNPVLLEYMYDNQLIIKSLLLGSFNKVRDRTRLSGDSTLETLYNLWATKRTLWRELIDLTPQERDHRGINLKFLEYELYALEKEFSRKSELYKSLNDYNAASWRDVQNQLTTQEAAIEMVRFRKFQQGKFADTTIFYAALIVKPESNLPKIILFENGKDLEGKYYRYYYNTIRAQRLSGQQNSYQFFWQSIDEQLKDIRKLYFSADGIYHKINLYTLLDFESFILDKYEIQLLNSSKDLITPTLNTNNPRLQNVTLIAPIKFGKTKGQHIFQSLLGTKQEILETKSLLASKKIETQSFLYNEANRTNLFNVEGSDILHIATHSGYTKQLSHEESNFNFNILQNDNPLMRSFFVLNMKDSDQSVIITAYEVMSLPLQNIKLVIFSGEAIGELKNSEGFYGLNRAFLQAGAKSVMSAIWPVNDSATVGLMKYFYQEYMDSNNANAAIRKAMIKVREEYKNPYYWGAFSLIGI